MGGYFRLLKQRYADFSGRTARKEFWWFQLYTWILLGVPFALMGVCVELEKRSGGAASGALQTVSLLSMLAWMVLGMALLVPMLAIGTRRLQDAGYSGLWWLLVFVPCGLGAIALMVLFLMDSQPGDNRYGPDPRRAG